MLLHNPTGWEGGGGGVIMYIGDEKVSMRLKQDPYKVQWPRT